LKQWLSLLQPYSVLDQWDFHTNPQTEFNPPTEYIQISLVTTASIRYSLGCGSEIRRDFRAYPILSYIFARQSPLPPIFSQTDAVPQCGMACMHIARAGFSALTLHSRPCPQIIPSHPILLAFFSFLYYCICTHAFIWVILKHVPTVSDSHR
jgi:hypothetical protein